MKLGGSIFIHDNFANDYCVAESVACLKELCDQVVVLDAGSTDGTRELVRSLADKKTKAVLCSNDEWETRRKELGREVLSYFSNKAKGFLSTPWYFSLQADEVIHENCFSIIGNFIKSKKADGFYCDRINLWGNSQHQLFVPLDRSPVGIQVLRLARSVYDSIDDAESIHVPYGEVQWQKNAIRIYHMGFIRDKFKHCTKVRNMQESIFQFSEMDKKVQAMNGVFDPWQHFSKQDVIPISEPLPKFVQKWAEERDRINDFKI